MPEFNEILLASEEVRSNTHKTVFLLCLMIASIFGLSWLLGEMIHDVSFGFKVGFLVSLIVIPLEVMSARFTILTLTGCVSLDLSNPAEKRILNIVQGLSISAGLPKVPDVYLIETRIPNAFSAGWNEESAFIGITTGLADIMDDQELEGVIAHEIAHIVHRDVMVCQAFLALNSALLVLALIIKWFSFIQIFFSKNNETRLVSCFLFLIIYPLSFIWGLLLCMMVSRKREYAADAFAVRLCAYNEGLARALEKLDNLPEYNKNTIEELGGKSVECLYFYFPYSNIFSTHPKTKERIHRLRAMY